jgi:hypothetical protein
MANSLPVVIASDQSAIPISDDGGSITVDGTVAATQSGTWNINNISGTVSLPTGAATETTLQQIADSTTASTASISNVVATTSSTQILAANAERKLAIFVNDADQPCLVKFGETASSSSFTYKLLAGDILELPTPIYTGRIDAIWTNAVTGNMRVTEL